MGLSVGSNVVGIRGGEKFDAYIRRDHAADLAQRFTRSFSMSAFKRKLPFKTGELRRTIYLRQRGTNVELRGVEYAKHVKWVSGGGGRTGVASTFRREAKRTLRRLGAIR